MPNEYALLEPSQSADFAERFLGESIDLNFAAHNDGRVYMLNPRRWQAVLGHLVADQAAWETLLGGADFDQIRGVSQQLMSGAHAVQPGLDVAVECADGSVHWFLWSAWRDEASGVLYGSGKDITARKQMEEGFRLFADLAEHVRTHPTLDTALELVLERLCLLSGWNQGEGWVVRGDALCLETTWHRDLAAPTESAGDDRLGLGESLATRAWTTGVPCWSWDSASDELGSPSLSSLSPAASCCLAIPVVVNQAVIAVLRLMRPSPAIDATDRHQFRVRHEAAAAALTVPLGTLLDCRRTGEDLAAVSEELRRSHKRFRALAQHASDGVGVIDESGSVVFVSPGLERITGFGPEHYLGRPAALHMHPSDWSADEYELLCSDPDTPLVREGRIAHADGSWRWVVVTQHNCFDDPSVGGIVTNLHDVTDRRQAEQITRRGERQQAAVAELGRRALSSEQLPLLVEEAAEQVRSVLEDVEVTIRHEPGEAAGLPGVWEDDENVGSVLHVPIGLEPDAYGAIEASKATGPFANDEVAFLQSVAALLSAAHQREQAEAAVIRAEEDARRLIAEDIHDDPLQVMIALGIRLGLLEERLDNEEDCQLVRSASADAREAANRLRGLMFDLHPRSLSETGLEATLLATLEYGAGQSGFQFELDYDLPREPLAGTRITIFRIAQEAITNVRLHAAADEVVVTVEARTGGTRCRISDDGRGMLLPQGEVKYRHLGLETMRHRAERAGGWFRLETRPGFGTDIDFWIPDRGFGAASDG